MNILTRKHFSALLCLLSLLTVGLTASAQERESITLEEVQTAAEEHFPLLRQREVLDRVVRESSRAMKYVYIPQISISGGVNYISDMPNPTKQDLIKGDKLQVALPSFLKEMGFTQEVWDGMMDETMASIFSQIRIPTIPKMQWGISASVAQILWDGGNAAASGRVLRASQAEQEAHMAEAMREVRKSVTDIYFGLLKVDAQAELQQTLIEELRRQEERAQAAIRNEVGTQADADEVRVELLKAAQDRAALMESRRALLEALTIYTGLKLTEETQVTEPATPSLIEAMAVQTHGRIAPLRPEHKRFDAQISSAQASYDQYLAGLVPQVMLFATAAYANPYPNIFKPGAHPFGMVGLSFQWNFGQLYGLGAQRTQLRGMTEMAEIQRQTFEQQMSAELAQAQRKVQRYAEQIRLDEEIVSLREAINDRSSVQVDEGVMTRRDALQLLTKYNAAQRTADLHRIEYLQALYELQEIQK